MTADCAFWSWFLLFDISHATNNNSSLNFMQPSYKTFLTFFYNSFAEINDNSYMNLTGLHTKFWCVLISVLIIIIMYFKTKRLPEQTNSTACLAGFHYRFNRFLHMWNKGTDQLCRYQLCSICTFVFALQIVQSFFFLNPIFQASSFHLWLNSPVWVKTGCKPWRPKTFFLVSNS